MADRKTRSGSVSNAQKARKSASVDKSVEQEQPGGYPGSREDEYDHDLAVSNRPAEGEGMGEQNIVGDKYAAYDLKELHTILADLTNDEMKALAILPTGTQLEQGAKYIDLKHLERGEFVADGYMIAEPDHYYVPKKETDYVLWNRLNQITNPARLDEPGSA
jgi:hypothetical protein